MSTVRCGYPMLARIAIRNSPRIFSGDISEPCWAWAISGRRTFDRARRARFREAAGKAEIFHNKEKKYSSFRKCGTCEYFEDCSVCPVSIGYDPENADPHRVPDFMCAFNMAKLKYRKQFPPMPDPAEMLEAIIAQTQRHPRASN